MIEITAPGVDTRKRIEQLLRKVEEKRNCGVYEAAGLSDKTLTAPLSFTDNESFLAFYIEHLRENTFVDITDFDITERRTCFKKPLIGLKKAIWGLLRFYTYRLWTQQNQINGLLLAAIEGIHEQQNKKTRDLELRIKRLEAREDQCSGESFSPLSES